MEGGRDSIKIALDVWDFALPQENHLPGDIWNGSMREMPADEELAYYQLARQHRFLPLIYAYRPGLKITGTNVALDWTEYGRRLASYLDGSAFKAEHGYWGPGYGIPIDQIMLPFNNEKRGDPNTAWPMAMPEGKRTPEYEAVWKETGRQIREHLGSNPLWSKVVKIAFLDGLDESYNEIAYEKMLYYGKLLHDALGAGGSNIGSTGRWPSENWSVVSLPVFDHAAELVIGTLRFDRRSRPLAFVPESTRLVDSAPLATPAT